MIRGFTRPGRLATGERNTAYIPQAIDAHSGRRMSACARRTGNRGTDAIGPPRPEPRSVLLISGGFPQPSQAGLPAGSPSGNVGWFRLRRLDPVRGADRPERRDRGARPTAPTLASRMGRNVHGPLGEVRAQW